MHHVDPTVRSECTGVRRHIYESEASSHGHIEEADALVRRVHGAQDVEIAGDGKRATPILRRRERETALVPLQESDQFTKGSCYIGTIDFVDHQEHRRRWVEPCARLGVIYGL